MNFILTPAYTQQNERTRGRELMILIYCPDEHGHY